MKKFFSLLLVLCLALSLGSAALAASSEPVAEDASLVLSDPVWELSEDNSYYALMNVPYCTNVVSPQYQYMNIYVPSVYMHGGSVNGYTIDTAPIVLLNNCIERVLSIRLVNTATLTASKTVACGSSSSYHGTCNKRGVRLGESIHNARYA